MCLEFCRLDVFRLFFLCFHNTFTNLCSNKQNTKQEALNIFTQAKFFKPIQVLRRFRRYVKSLGNKNVHFYVGALISFAQCTLFLHSTNVTIKFRKVCITISSNFLFYFKFYLIFLDKTKTSIQSVQCISLDIHNKVLSFLISYNGPSACTIMHCNRMKIMKLC